MSEFRYRLEPYKSGGSNRFTCPKCGRHRCFSKYINCQTGEYVDDSCGKCDHEQSCGYHYTPGDYHRDNPERTPFVPMSKPMARLAKVKEETASSRPICVIDPMYVTRSLSKASQFVTWLRTTVGDDDAVERVCQQYHVGATRDGGVIFWQIDAQGSVRTGKVMHYWGNGHRVKDSADYARMLNAPYTDKSPSPTFFIHSKMKSQRLLPAEWQVTQCLFGEHLLSRRPDDIVYLVESEKTALICAAYYPQFVWVATGGGGNLSADKVMPLIGRVVKIIPDSGELEKWSKIMDSTKGIKYAMVRELERYPPNTDIADVLLGEAEIPATDMPMTGEHPRVEVVNKDEAKAATPTCPEVEEMKMLNPSFDMLCDAFDLEMLSVNNDPCPF